MTNCQQIPPI